MSSAKGFLHARDFGLPEAPPCPFCDGAETELHTAFGSAISVATYWCRTCRTAFDFFKANPSDANNNNNG